LINQTAGEVKKIFVLIIFIFWGNCEVFSQTVRRPVSAAYLGLGSYSNNHIDVFSFHSNQAALARLNNVMVGVYGERRFLLEELSLYNAVVAVPTHSGNFGLDGRYYGFSDYNETQLGLAYGRSLGGKVDIGVQFNYYAVRVAAYGSASTFNFEMGTVLHLTEKINAGLHVYNPVGGTLGRAEEEKLVPVYTAGFGFEASDRFFLSTEIEKEEGQPVNVNAGLQYRFVEQLMARIGISSATSSMYFGVGVKWKSFRLDATASYHQQLGITPGLVLFLGLFSNAKTAEESN
jgi:hypothetical protein